MRLDQLFLRCLRKSYIHVENDGDYATERIGNTLYIYLQCSDSDADWKNNLDFPSKPYRRMGHTLWLAHRGFLRVWKSVEGHLSPLIQDTSLDGIITVGYSHGAALAVFCHEYVWYHRPDLRHRIEGYGFGCPRVLWGFVPSKLRTRWDRFLCIRNLDDVVTHLPPAFLGYTHVGHLLKIGEADRYSAIDAHRPQNILSELYAFEKERNDTPLFLVERATR